MNQLYPHVFAPFTIKRTTFRNRVIMPPMGSNLATFTGEVSEEMKTTTACGLVGAPHSLQLKMPASIIH